MPPPACIHTTAEQHHITTPQHTPITSHPLSFMELERHGYEDLVLPIIEYGGPHEVGVRIGIEWEDPIEEKIQIDESLRPKRVESTAFDIQGH